MSFVFISACDDYGHASLSYAGYVESDVSGQDFTFSQLVSYLHWYYLNWGGRVVFHGLMILMLKNVWIIRIIQAAAIFVSFFALHRLSIGGKGNAKTVLLCCSLYGAFSFETFRAGIYFFSASAVYILPLPFLCIGIIIMQYLEKKTENRLFLTALGCFCFLLAGISQENIAIALLVLIFVLCFYDYLANRKIKLYRLPFLLASLLGSSFLLLAPGNFTRLNFQNADVSSLSSNLSSVCSLTHLRSAQSKPFKIFGKNQRFKAMDLAYEP
jgi:hypothetical protein